MSRRVRVTTRITISIEAATEKALDDAIAEQDEAVRQALSEELGVDEQGVREVRAAGGDFSYSIETTGEEIR